VSRKSSDWYVPTDWACLFGLWVVLPAEVILASCLLPALAQLKEANVVAVFYSGLAVGCFGIVLLFLARLPFYRQRRFWTFGPSALPNLHRKLYWLAYAAIVATLLLLGIVWLRVT
jgi:hypothetical protein